MGLHESIYDEYDFVRFEDELEDKYDQILNSDLSMLKIWLSLLGEETIIKTRPNNIFYSKCCFHRAQDIPVCINDNNKGFFCYGCGRGGTVVTLIEDYFRILIEDAIKILYAYINNDLTSLNDEELKILKTIFKNYDSSLADKYFLESKDKTDCLNDRIDRYFDKFGDSPETIKKMTKRLCCSRNYIIGRKSDRN